MTTRTAESFSKQMRIATRDVHKLSDALVNAKLAFALAENHVWADGLLIFYEIFKHLEKHAPIDLLPEDFRRTAAFESDLTYYLGASWKDSYEPREAVKKYIAHLNEIEKENPILLMAFIYHLYMGLLSGGQILKKKRAVAKKISVLKSKEDETQLIGHKVTHFEGVTIAELKERMRSLVDEKAKNLDDKTKDRLIVESRKVFELNNEIIRTVRGVNRVNLKQFFLVSTFVIIMYLLYKLLFT